MATGQVSTSAGYALGAKQALNRPTRRIRKKMKLTFKQRIRNWLNSDLEIEADVPHSLTVEESRLQSDGIRLQVYKASGGYVVETRGYDRKTCGFRRRAGKTAGMAVQDAQQMQALVC